jgi:DNA-binding response OmpR family regulator
VHGFLTLPVNIQELDARVRFAQWKNQAPQLSQDVLEIDDLRLNLATYEATVAGETIDLTFKEFELLKFFITHPRRVYTRPELLETVWESDYYGGTRTVDVHIRRLRAKIGPKVGKMINTVRNVGYRFG